MSKGKIKITPLRVVTISIPAMFIIWVITSFVQTISIRNTISLNVDLVSELSYLRDDISTFKKSGKYLIAPEERKELMAYLTSKSDALVLGLPERLYDVYNNQKVTEFDKLEKEIVDQVALLRLELREKSIALESYWYQIYFIGIVACLALFLATLLLYKNRSQSYRLNALINRLNESNEDLKTQKIELEKSNETKKKLFAIISHDLRNPVGALKGYFDLLEEGEIGADSFSNFSHSLKQEVDKVHFTLNNLLFWAKDQMDGFSTKPIVFDISLIVHENVNLFKNIAKEKGVKIENAVSAQEVKADIEQIRVVVRNLISNAVKYTRSNAIIRVSAKQENDNVWILVEDNGIGIDKDTLNRLFTKEPVESKYGTQGEKGTGLGLVLSKDFVEMNGGEIMVLSELGKGSTFSFSIPRR
ncbi:MAG: HAMP domain-containing histidine kinase [Bacteroidia bacterium]